MSHDEDMLVCPYNRSHVISKLRMARHLVKCQANYPNVFFATCFYDFLHRVPPEELDEHLKNCPSKNQFPVRFCTEDDSANDEDPQVQKIFITKKALESAKTPEWGAVGGMPLCSTSTKNKGGVPKSSTESHTAPGGSKTTTSTGGRKESTTNPPFVLKYSASEHKGKKSSKPKEESWDTESSDEEQQEGSTSSTSTCKEYSHKDDGGSITTDGSSSFKGDDEIDEEGFIKVRSKNKSKRRNK